MGITNIILLLGGVALFLFGMGLMGDSLKLVAGQKLEMVLYRLTNTALKGVLLGTVVTAIIQSSSATSAMVVGFVNAGMMQLSQGIGIVLGSNIGTSVTGWILCLSYIGNGSSALSLLSTANITAVVALVGIIIRMTGKDAHRKHVGDILLGFAVLMYGMQAMSSAVSPLRESKSFLRLMTMFSNPVLGILIGTLITAVLQSNSASVGILQALSVTGTITFAAAFPMIMGMGIGAAVPVLVSAIGANRDGKRTALIYLFSSVIGTAVYSILFYSVNAVVHFPVVNETVGPVGIAVINSVFRICSVVILMPFLKQLQKLTGRLVRVNEEDLIKDALTEDLKKLEDRFITHPALAIEQSRVVTNSMALRAQDNFVAALELFKQYDAKGFRAVQDMEEAVDKYEDSLGSYLMKVTARELTHRQNGDVSKFLHTIGDFERISDHSMNMAEAAQEIHDKGITFSPSGMHELSVLRSAVCEILSLAVCAFIDNDISTAMKVEPLEEVIDGLCDELKLHHIVRLQEGSCTLGQGYIFNDIVTNYERVADHCSNIAVAMIELEEDAFDTHEYLKSLKDIRNEEFIKYYDDFSKKFFV